MTDKTRILEDGWAHLDARSKEEVSGEASWHSFDTGMGPTKRKFLLAIDQAKGQHLLIPCEHRDSIPHSSRSALTIAKRDFDFGWTASGTYLDICCTSESLDAQFRTVVSDVVERSSESSDPARTASEVVTEWRLLFAEFGKRPPLTLQRRMSLFAELSVLLELADALEHLDMTWWSGPDLQPHDVEHSGFSVEVKAVGAESSTVQIHGADQLEEVDGKPLFLAVRTVVESDNGRSLSELAREVSRRSSNRSTARSKLFKAGITAARDAPDPIRFKIIEGFAVRVSDATPKITSSMIDGGVDSSISGFRYEVDLGVLAGLAESSSLTNVIGAM